MTTENIVVLTATALLLAYIGVLVFALTQIFRTTTLTQLEKWLWTIALIVFPVVVLIGWYLLDPGGSRNRRKHY